MKPNVLKFQHGTTIVGFEILEPIKADRFVATASGVRVVIDPHVVKTWRRGSVVRFRVVVNGVRPTEDFETPHEAARAAIRFVKAYLPQRVDGFSFEERNP